MADRRQGTPATGDGGARGKVPASPRDARLASALKANIARRKARLRALDETSGDPAHSGDDPSEKD